MLSTKPNTSLDRLLGNFFICSISLDGIVSNHIHILSSMSMKLLARVVVFSFNPYIMRNRDCCIKWIPVLKKRLLLISLILRDVCSIRARFRSTFSLCNIYKGWANVKSVVYLILFKRFVFLKSLYLLHVKLVLCHCELGF